MAESFGARMRERREQQQISLIAISEQTKIKLSLLDALERDDVSQWPTGIFRRAFIRAYARAVDLDADAVVREFLERYPDPAEAVGPVPALEPGSVNDSLHPAPPMRLRFLVRSAVDTVARRWIDFHGKGRPAADPIADRVGRAEPADAVDRLASPPPVMAAPIPAKTNVVQTNVVETNLAETDLYVELDLAGEGEGQDASMMLRRAAGLLDAVGLVVWTWDAKESELVPALAHGYSDQVLAQMPTVRSDADNATAAAFRSAQTCIVKSSEEANGAVVVPLMTPSGCVGVFAVELPRGAEQREPVRALTTSLAAQFADLLRAPGLPHAVSA
jgi:transcriptional regulator with XRE-family HTH domain